MELLQLEPSDNVEFHNCDLCIAPRMRRQADSYLYRYQLDDVPFIDKVLAAGNTNSLILSDTEIIRARSLLNHAEELSSGTSLQTLCDAVTRLRVALAAHKLLPKEIVTYIFSLVHAGQQAQFRNVVPVIQTQSPWVLGQRLKHAIQIIPDICLLNLNIELYANHDPTNLELYEDHFQTLFPYLYQVDTLTLSGHAQNSQLLKSLQPDSLSKLRKLFISLTFNIADGLAERSAAASARLEELSVWSNYPEVFLQLDISWSNIRILNLGFAQHTLVVCTLPAEVIRRSNPFPILRKLEVLGLCIWDLEIFPLIIDTPWRQLVHSS
ncbi:hypothetical protein H0H93_001596 [Arthromyces matolae]|nr:hypothetical protein H0H93_001596 [Arthromyces matolae]